MAALTLTCSVFDAQPKNVEEGVVSVSGQYTWSTSVPGTVGDIVFLAKIPHGAKFVDCYFDHTTGAAGGSAFTMQYGFAKGGASGGAASYSAVCSAGNAGAVIRKTVLGVPADISCSDSDPNRWGILSAQIVANTSPTAVNALNFVYTYRCDGAGG